MNCHLVPSTYLKNWKIGENIDKIYVFDSKDCSFLIEEESAEIKDSNFAKIDFYILDAFSDKVFSNYFNILEDEFLLVLSRLTDKYKFFYKGEEIDSCIHPSTVLNISSWQFVKEGEAISFGTFKLDFCAEWEDNEGKIIENFFSRNVEREWGNVVKYLSNEIIKGKTIIPAKHKDKIIEFLAIQKTRIIENSDKHTEMVVSAMRDIVKGGIPHNF